MIIYDVPQLTIDQEIRFWFHVEIKGLEDCWNFIGRLSSYSGHCRYDMNGKSYLAHRIAYKIKYKENIENILICHKCDNPRCCNHNHLFKGTAFDNINDSIKKGRHSSVINTPESWSKKLNREQVLEIRQKAYSGITQKQLSKEYAVGISTISRIIYKETWANV